MDMSILLTAVQPVYDLVEIEEDAVPLAVSFQSGMGRFANTTWLMFAIAMTVAVFGYAAYCNVRRSRVVELLRSYRQEGYKGWNPRRLSRERARLEAEIVEQAENRKSWKDAVQYYEFNDFDDYEDDYDHEVSDLDVAL